MFCCAVTGASTLLAAEATSATGAERTAQFLRQRQPVVLDRETLEAGMRPLPDNMPIRRVTVRPGQKAEIGGVAGATGTLVYKNTLGANFFAPGANVQVADDLLLIAAGGCDMSFLEVLVTGGGNGSGPGFHVDFSLFTGCPGQGGTLIPGTEGEADLTDNGGWLVSIDLEGTEVTIPADPWLALKVSTTAAGWVLGRPAGGGLHREPVPRTGVSVQCVVRRCSLCRLLRRNVLRRRRRDPVRGLPFGRVLRVLR